MMLTNAMSAQITITSADMPISGDTIRYSVGTLDTLSAQVYTQTDTNYVWDFSQLTANSQGLSEYVPVGATPYNGFFPGSYGLELVDTLNLAGQTITAVYDFYKNTATQFEATGRGMNFQGFPLATPYSDADEIYQFPLDYGDRDSSTFDFLTGIPFVASYITTGYRINEVNGWGTVMTPYDTVSCIRVVTDVVSMDSISILGQGGFSFPNHVREIKWIANGEKIPMVQVSGTVAFGAFVPTEIRYRDNYLGLSNPFAPNANFTADNRFPEQSMDTVTFTAIALPLPTNSYTWGFTPNTVTYVNGTNNNSQNPEVVFDAPGTYDVYMYIGTDFGTDDTTKLDYITVATVGTSNLIEENALKVFPNPITEGQVNVAFNLKNTAQVDISLMDLQGRVVRTLKNETLNAGTYQNQFNTSDLTGLYLLNIKIDGQQQTYKLMLK